MNSRVSGQSLYTLYTQFPDDSYMGINFFRYYVVETNSVEDAFTIDLTRS